jgi:pimeloyl-ACP methyl ester carboxylesterase
MKTLVFAHANSFPAGCYRRLFDHWRAAGWRVEAPDRFGHDPRYPVTDGWRHLRDELIEYIERDVRPDGPVAVVGHSLGGMLGLMAVCRRPELVNRLVLLDSPVVAGVKAGVIGVARRVGLMHRYPPSRIARDRRDHWPDRAALHAHFASKAAFAAWHPQALQDYLDAGFEDADDGVRLRFRRDVESHIYRAVPHHFGPLLRRHPPACPVGFIAGTQSTELRMAGIPASRRLAGARWRWVEGTHLYPFERPDDTARMVVELLD